MDADRTHLDLRTQIRMPDEVETASAGENRLIADESWGLAIASSRSSLVGIGSSDRSFKPS